jgi:hypothetical protein
MRTKLMIATAAAAALLAGGAFAQASGSNFSQSAGDTAVNPPAVVPAPAPAAGSDVAAPPAIDATVAPAAGPATERTSAASVSGGVDVVSNGPVPDTPENRAKYGKPMSNAGRMTKPAGN